MPDFTCKLLAEALPQVTSRVENGRTIDTVTVARRGDILVLPQSEVDRLLPHQVIEILDNVTPDKEKDSEPVTPDSPYNDEDKWSYSDLQAEAKKRGLPATGSRQELVERLSASE